MINNKQKSTPQKVEANPIISLFQNHINKDIDQNFVDALEALLFLTNADSGTFQQTFPYRLPPDFFNNIDETKNKDMDDFLNHLKNKNSHKKSTSKSWIDEDGNDIVNLNKYWLGHEDHDDEFHSAIHQQLTNKSKSEKQPTHVNYTPVDMLVYKLLENLRRLYSAEKAQERKLTLEEQYKKQTAQAMGLNKHVNSTSLFNLLNQSKFNHTAKQTQEPLNNENTLKLQQGYIYQCLDLVKPYAKLSHHKKWFEKAILGNHAQISALELWAYLGLHEFVQPEHREKHNNFFMHSLSGHKFELSLLEQMSSIVIPIEQTQLLKNIFAHSDIKNLCDSAYTNRQNKKATHTWMLNVTEYLFNPDNKISSSDFSTSEKLAAITSIISSKLLDSSYYEKFINVYPDFFENLKSQTTGPEFEQLYKSSIYKLQFSHIATNTRTVQFLFNNVQKLEDVDFMANTIKSTALSTRQKDDIFNLYDISDIKFLKNVATKLHTTTSDSNIKEVMGGFLGMQQNATNKELITHIISLDSKYMPICKSAYLQIRISENVKDKPDSHHEKNSRHKL